MTGAKGATAIGLGTALRAGRSCAEVFESGTIAVGTSGFIDTALDNGALVTVAGMESRLSTALCSATVGRIPSSLVSGETRPDPEIEPSILTSQ